MSVRMVGVGPQTLSEDGGGGTTDIEEGTQ